MQDQSGRSLHVVVKAREAQAAINVLKREKIYDRTRKVFRDGENVFIPVTGRNVTYMTIMIEGRENNLARYPSRSAGSYDVIGDIAVIHNRKGIDAGELASRIMSGRTIRSVYLDDGVYGGERIRKLTLLAGLDDPVTLHRENGIMLKVDISRVYFSPRLATERMRILRKTSDGEAVLDMFAGVGPFSILLAKYREVSVTSMDINPVAIDLLRINAFLNKIEGKITPLLGDSSTLIRDFKDLDRIIMNLPHGSLSFMEQALSSLKLGGHIHYYEICSQENLLERMRFFRSLGLSIVGKREVHGYSPREMMYALDLRKEQL